MYSKQDLLEYVGKVTLAIMIIIAGILCIASLISIISPPVSAQTQQTSSMTSQPTTSLFSESIIDSPNLVTGFFALTINGLSNFANSTVANVNETANQFTSAASVASKSSLRFLATSAKVTAQGIGSGIKFVGNSLVFAGKGVLFIGKTFASALFTILKLPGFLFSKVTTKTLNSSLVRPSDYQSAELIDPNSTELLTALTALPPTETNKNSSSVESTPINISDGPIWPIKGRITTQFGVAHWPYQPTHTGLDISDGKRSGTTAIKPFRSGKVIETIKSNSGYGNHVIVDHGNGVTSWYAHLYSISVKVGDQVSTNTTIGYEGSTGMSTGTHLHFEVRVNNKVADPHKFVAGEPY